MLRVWNFIQEFWAEMINWCDSVREELIRINDDVYDDILGLLIEVVESSKLRTSCLTKDLEEQEHDWKNRAKLLKYLNQ